MMLTGPTIGPVPQAKYTLFFPNLTKKIPIRSTYVQSYTGGTANLL